MFTKLDIFNRVAIPRFYLESLGIEKQGEVEIYVDNGEIIVRKPVMGCVFCRAAFGLVRLGDLCACRPCIERLYEAEIGEVIYPNKIEK